LRCARSSGPTSGRVFCAGKSVPLSSSPAIKQILASSTL
jgi:hypothetical protein